MATSSENQALIKTNKRDLFGVEAKVFRNKQALYEERADIEKNHDLIWRNYHSAFQGNRQMANLNTDAIFKNRRELLASMVINPEDPVQANYRASHMNKQKIEFLDNRSKLNEKVANVNATMSGINAELIEINKAIMCANGIIVAFNTEQLEKNSAWLADSSLEAAMKAATPDDNKTKIDNNAKRINEIADRARANLKSIHESLEGKISANKDLISTNKAKIEEHRLKIKENAATIRENQKQIIAKVYGAIASKYAKAAELSQEQKDNVRKTFDAVDANKNGKIEANEFKKMMETLKSEGLVSVEMTDEQVTALFKGADLNADSLIDFDEFCKLIGVALAG